jgi:hypothetical protein
MSSKAARRHGESLNPFCYMRKDNLKGLHAVQFQLSGILGEKRNQRLQ